MSLVQPRLVQPCLVQPGLRSPGQSAGSRITVPAFLNRNTPRYNDDGVLSAAYEGAFNAGKYGKGLSIEEPLTNLFTAAESQGLAAPTTKSLAAGTYTVSVDAGTGGIALSGGPTGTATLGTPVTFTLGGTTSVTFTPSGTVSRCQLINKSYALTWHIGGSARGADGLICSTTGLFTPKAGYVVIWKNDNSVSKRASAGVWPTVVNITRADGAFGVWLYHSSSLGAHTFQTRDDADSPSVSGNIPDPVDGQHMYCIRWCPAVAAASIDGGAPTTVAIPKLPAAFGNMVIGSRNGTTGIDFANTTFDDLECGDAYPTDAEVAAWFASGAPATWKAHTMLLAHFDGDLSYQKRAA